MIYHISRDGTILGEFTEAEFRDKIFANEILPNDHYWTEGMTDWQVVSDYRVGVETPEIVPVPPSVPVLPQGSTDALKAPVSAKLKVKRSAAYTGACLALIAAFLPLLSGPLIFVSLILLLATFILAVTEMVKGKVWHGVGLLLSLFIALAMAITCTVDRDKLLRHEPLVTRGESDIEQEAQFATAIEKHHVIIGMTANQCRQAWGTPRSINRTTTSSGKREQWVYDGSYLYLDNGVLRSFQN
jgi:hypothetical protein